MALKGRPANIRSRGGRATLPVPAGVSAGAGYAGPAATRRAGGRGSPETGRRNRAGQATVRGGRSRVRAVLYMAVWVASRFHPVIRAF